jgi:hypothetical protein
MKQLSQRDPQKEELDNRFEEEEEKEKKTY